jgi:hypothetical protein
MNSAFATVVTTPWKGLPMPFDDIVNEVEQLRNVGTRLEKLAADHPPVSTELIIIAGNVRITATLLAVLLVTKLHGSEVASPAETDATRNLP